MLRLTPDVHVQMVGHCLGSLPEEACGLLAGVPGTSKAAIAYPTRNAAGSARIYSVDPSDHLRADRDAQAKGMEIVGVFHSHTHTPPYPSATDVAQAPDPSWHYVLVSLAAEAPVLRSYRIVDGEVREEPVALDSR